MKVFSAENETVKLEIHYDEDAPSPRDDDNLGVIVGWHRRYTIGDEQPDVPMNVWIHQFRSNDYVMIPIYMYDHGGIALSCESFVGRAHHAEWDSGQVGYIYTTRERADELGVDWNPEVIRRQLRAEVEVYGQYMNGDVFGFIVNRKQPCGHWDHDDSCWGFYYGSDWDNNGLADELADDVRPLLKELHQ